MTTTTTDDHIDALWRVRAIGHEGQIVYEAFLQADTARNAISQLCKDLAFHGVKPEVVAGFSVGLAK
jgi:hypothetical protein